MKGIDGMKILCIDCAKIKYMPYVHFYLDALRGEQNTIHLAYWNRDMQEEDVSALSDIVLHEFRYKMLDETPKLLKLKGFYKYRKHLKKIIKHNDFDFIFVFGPIPALCILKELKAFNNKFVFDYRDSSYERFALFRKLLNRIVALSKITFVSSDAFRALLPETQKDKIYTSHNILLDSLKHREERQRSTWQDDTKVRMSFWGLIRNEDVNIEIINRLGNDARFELHYYGREQQTAKKLKEYIRVNQIKNVVFHGEYRPEERYQFVNNTDIIHNIYSKNDKNTMLAMGNKYYDGIIFRIPQVCMTGSFMGEQVQEKGIGIALEPSDTSFNEKLYQYVKNIKTESFSTSCDIELERVLKEYQTGVDIIKGL